MTAVLWRFPVCSTVSVLCTVAALWIDVGSWAQGGPVGPGSEWFRFARTVAAVLPVAGLWRTRPDADTRWLTLAMVLVVVADTFLILRHDLLSGIAWFALVQVLLIIRHGRGVPPRRWLSADARPALLLAAAIVIVTNNALWPSLATRGLAWPVLVYSVLVVTTVVVAWGRAGWGLCLLGLPVMPMWAWCCLPCAT